MARPDDAKEPCCQASWHIDGRYLTYQVAGSIENAAKSLINFVNVQGAGPVVLQPQCMDQGITAALERLDPNLAWHKWWQELSGEELALTNEIHCKEEEPKYALPAEPGRRLLGINVGGHFLRLVWIFGGHVEASEEIKLGTAHGSALSHWSLGDFVETWTSKSRSRGLDCVGIAWSAPRGNRLRAMSIQMDTSSELGRLLERDELDQAISKSCGCPVFSWNDGEAVAAAEEISRSRRGHRPLLVLKLGTSIAAGLASNGQVSALPIQIAKCLLMTHPIYEYEHPIVFLRGTVRDSVGAEPIVHTYRRLSKNSKASYLDFCVAAEQGDTAATMIVHTEAAVLVELAELIGDLWSPVDLILTGKNIERPLFRQVLLRAVRDEIKRAGARTRLLGNSCDANTCAAVGAVALSLGQLLCT